MIKYMLTVIYKNGDTYDYAFNTKENRKRYAAEVKSEREPLLKGFTYWEKEVTYGKIISKTIEEV